MNIAKPTKINILINYTSVTWHFFVNKKNAKSADMKSLINFVKKKVKDKTGVKLDLEIVLVE